MRVMNARTSSLPFSLLRRRVLGERVEVPAGA